MQVDAKLLVMQYIETMDIMETLILKSTQLVMLQLEISHLSQL